MKKQRVSKYEKTVISEGAKELKRDVDYLVENYGATREEAVIALLDSRGARYNMLKFETSEISYILGISNMMVKKVEDQAKRKLRPRNLDDANKLKLNLTSEPEFSSDYE